MSRYRPPRKPGSFYITPEGYTKLRNELDYLWRTWRPQVTQSVSEAAAMGDRSENAEYIYGKKLLRQIDSRVHFLRKRLDQLTIVTTLPEDINRVYFGAWVTVEDEDGAESTWRIVGPDEFDLKKGLLSMDSPLARALMGKTLDDEITIQVNGKETCYCVTGISYQGS